VVRRIFGSKGAKTTEGWKICMTSFLICTPHQTLERPNQGGRVGPGMYHTWEGSAYKVLVGKPKEEEPLLRPRHK
jgi:hypothetical protein